MSVLLIISIKFLTKLSKIYFPDHNSQISFLLNNRNVILWLRSVWQSQLLNIRRLVRPMVSICNIYTTLLRPYLKNTNKVYKICRATDGSCITYEIFTPRLHADVHVNGKFAFIASIKLRICGCDQWNKSSVHVRRLSHDSANFRATCRRTRPRICREVF